MGMVIIFWVMMGIIVIIQVGAIIYHVKYGNIASDYDGYSNEVRENARNVINAIRLKIVKKHLLTNSADKYDSGKTLKQYKFFLKSDLMKDMLQMDEEQYNG